MPKSPLRGLRAILGPVTVGLIGVAVGCGGGGPASRAHPGADLIAGRWMHTATLLPSGKVLIAGGSAAVPGNGAELYDPVAGTFSATGVMTASRFHNMATLLATGKVLIAGGDVSDNPTAELYDPDSGTFVATGDMTATRSGESAVLLRDGRVLIAGSAVDASAELYDPISGTFTSAGSMTAVRSGPTATLLPSGKVLIAGGEDYTAGEGGELILASAEIYDPADGTFSPTGPMSQPRSGHTATLLGNGKVLIAGGAGFSPLLANDTYSSAEVYDPAAGQFAAVGSMARKRMEHTATLLPSGEVLMVDGDSYNASADLFDPTTGKFVSAGAMIAPRIGHSATLLPTGAVLIAGGYPGLASTELYR